MILWTVVFLFTTESLALENLVSFSMKDAIDLSYWYKQGETVFWPGAGEYIQTPVKYDEGEKVYIKSFTIALPEHGGTHMDAPNHFARGKWSVDQIPLHHLIAEGIRVDIRKQVIGNQNYTLQVADLKEWEKENGRIPNGSILFVYTGWGKHYLEPFYIENAGVKSFPGVSGEAAKWLVTHRRIVGIGIDTASIDHGPSVLFPAHVILANDNIYNLENVANMDQLPGPKGYIVTVMPIKLAGGSGGPTRIYAFKSGCSKIELSMYTFTLLLILKLICF